MCVRVCASRIIGALYSLALSLAVCPVGSYLRRPHRRSEPRSARGRIEFSPTPKDKSPLRLLDRDPLGVTVTELEGREFVNGVAIKRTDGQTDGLTQTLFFFFLSDRSAVRLLVRWPPLLTDEVFIHLPTASTSARRSESSSSSSKQFAR